MFKSQKQSLHSLGFYKTYFRWNSRRKNLRLLKRWLSQGCKYPPPHIIKQSYLKNLAKEHSLSCLIETGTYQGDMVFALEPYFSQIDSIEIDQSLFENAKKRFRSTLNVNIHLGDSSYLLKEILQRTKSPSLIWLDGHYSGEGTGIGEQASPILNEINDIAKYSSVDCVVAIDDLNYFHGTQGYPEKKQLILKCRELGLKPIDDSLNILSLKLEK